MANDEIEDVRRRKGEIIARNDNEIVHASLDLSEIKG